MRALLCLALLCAASVYAKKSYDGYQVLRVEAETAIQLEGLRKLAENFKLDFWSEPFLRRPTDINVPPSELRETRKVLSKLGLTPFVTQPNVQLLVDRDDKPKDDVKLKDIVKGLAQKGIKVPKVETFLSKGDGPKWLHKIAGQVRAEIRAGRPNATQFSNSIVNTFPRHQDTMDWLEARVSNYPDLAAVEDIGTSYEGRTQKMIKVGKAGRANKPIIWVDSAIHAREWLTVGTTLWIIDFMLQNYQSNNDVKDLMDFYDWYFLPISNPDGYEYTHTDDRLWRKTRKPVSGSWCVGTDPNRNWDYQWGVSGTSTSPCSSTYGGPYAFSEPCVVNMKNKIMELSSRIKLYMGVHSYSQMWLTPWAYGSTKPSDNTEMLRVANKGNTALQRVHGKRFQVGAPPDILYAASGGAYDWAKAVAGIKYSYTFELRPDGNAWDGFVVPESEIQPSGEEVWAALAEVARDLKDK